MVATGYVLYNQNAGDKDTLDCVMALEYVLCDELIFIDITSIEDYRIFIAGLEKDAYIILSGGDGTLNGFINNIDGIEFENDVLYYPTGTGNDFAYDLGHSRLCRPFSIKKHLKGLPYVTVNNKSYRFINGVGYGIDGYCCEVGDKLKKTPGKKVNYTSIAIKGLLFHYKPTNARVTVDGEVHTYKKVWIAPTMNGRFYGGGMMPTPNQERNTGVLSTMIFHGSGKLNTLRIFPSLFKGEHIKHNKHVEILKGNEITVEFDRPVALQIDGETITGVTSYKAVGNGGLGKNKDFKVTYAPYKLKV
ncbi:MAG: diacylglycerol kinase family protein [Ruminococcaceae bacterium]|nr:diacylglycerol kinase family protein [Oscillospiraceae bacterium]